MIDLHNIFIFWESLTWIQFGEFGAIIKINSFITLFGNLIQTPTHLPLLTIIPESSSIDLHHNFPWNQ